MPTMNVSMSDEQTNQKEIQEIEKACQEGDSEKVRQKITDLTARVVARLSDKKIEPKKDAKNSLAQKIRKIQNENV